MKQKIKTDRPIQNYDGGDRVKNGIDQLTFQHFVAKHCGGRMQLLIVNW